MQFSDLMKTFLPRITHLGIVTRDGSKLRYVPQELQNDKEIVIAAVKQNGWALQFASPTLQDDKEVVKAAITQCCFAFQYASSRLCNDKEIVITAVAECGSNLKHASSTLKDDKEVVTAAIAKNGNYLEYASKRLQDDKELAIEACKRGSNASLYISPRLKEDIDVIFANVQNSYMYFKHLSEELRSNREYVLAVVKYCGKKLQYASEELKSDRLLVLASCQNKYREGGMFYTRDEKTKYKKKRARLYYPGFVKNEYGTDLYNRDSGFPFASPELRSDEKIVAFAMLQSHGFAYCYATEKIRAMGIYNFIQKQIEQIRSQSCTIILSRVTKFPDIVVDIITSYYGNPYTIELVRRWLVIKKHHEDVGEILRRKMFKDRLRLNL